jgi:hypothetical protein
LTAGIIAAITIAVIVFLLSIPLELSFHLGVREELDFHVRLGWFFSLVKKEFGRHKKQAKKRAGRGWTFIDLLRIRGLLPKTVRLLKDVFRCIRIRDLRVDFRMGLDDPADTALFVGSLWLPTFLLGLTSPYTIRLQPSFDNGPVFQGYAYVALRLRPIQLVPAIARFACSRAAVRLLGALVSGRWKRKK